MVFSEPAFLFLFLPGLLLAYFCVRSDTARNRVLLIGSLLFYSLGEWRFVGILLLSIALNYVIALGLDRWRGTSRAAYLLALGLASDLGLLVYFKYANWLVDNFNTVLTLAGGGALMSLSPVVLPLGISFFTFHKMSYKIDIFRGHAEFRRQPLELALYILLFPQLIAGPIVRYHEIAGQLAHRVVTRAGFACGVRRFIVGLGKKLLIANSLAVPADQIFALAPGEMSTSVAWLGLICYTLQIYFDFSGYSDMAIGLARMFGFRFPENFRYPYTAQSLTEFWRRWHITLSRWFRDYLYIPLGGNRVAPQRVYFNLLTVFFLCGLWHGASWNFIVWGLLHGVFLVVERLGWGRVLQSIPRPLRHVYTLLVVMVAWVFFRAENGRDAFLYLACLAGNSQPSPAAPLPLFLDSGIVLALVAGILAATPFWKWVLLAVTTTRRQRRRPLLHSRRQLAPRLALVTTLAHLFVFALSLIFLAGGTYNPFIYYRF